MAIETEVKLRLADPEGFRQRVLALGGALETPVHFEDNLVVDSAAAGLRRGGCLLRLRLAHGRAVLTYKGPERREGAFKSREEIETTVSDAAAVLDILSRLGLVPWFRYQKFREEYRVELPGAPALHLAVDRTPLGSFAELEGSEAAIARVAADLGFTEHDFMRESYYALHAQACAARGEPVGDMVFTEADGRG